MGLAVRALCLVLLLATTSAHAQSRDQARRLFDRGAAAMNDGRFGEARDLFRRSLSLFPNAGTAFNLAVALERTGELVEAVGVFDALREEAFGALQRAQLSEVERLRASADAGVGVLELTIPDAIDGLEVRVDGEVYDLGPIRLDPGTHVVLATAPRHEPHEQRIEMERGGRQALSLSLELAREATVGTLIVQADDPDDRVEIVGIDSGTGRLERELEPGRYEVVVRDGRRERRSQVEVVAGNRMHVRLGIERASRPWLWVGLGALLLGAAAAATAVAVTRDDVAPPINDDVYGTIQTLRSQLFTREQLAPARPGP